MIGRRGFIIGAAAFVGACGLGGGPNGQIRLGAGDPGGMYLAFAEILADRIRAHYPDLTVEVLPTEGTVENLERLRAGDIDMGMALADVVERDRQQFVAVARVYENYLQVVVRESAAMQRLSDLRGMRVSLGAARSGGAVTADVLFDAAGLTGQFDARNYRLMDSLKALADNEIDALVWSGGVPTPAIAELDGRLPLRMLDIGDLAASMRRVAGYPYVSRRAPSGGYAPVGVHSIGVPDLLLSRGGTPAEQIAAVIEVIVQDAPQLVPPYVRGLQYLAPPSMIQTGTVPLHPGAVDAYRRLHG